MKLWEWGVMALFSVAVLAVIFFGMILVIRWAV